MTESLCLEGLANLYAKHEVDKTWANSPSFDLIILEGHWETPPWTYREELDFRTLRWAAKRKGWIQPETEPTHNALEDCRLQVKLLMEMLNV